MSEKAKVCELCEEQPATLLCSECYKCYCDECSKLIHAMTKKKGHKTEAIPEGVVVDAMCPLHNDALRMLCVDEVKLCCAMCTNKIEDLHKGHNTVKVSEITRDNEIFSVSDVRKHFADVLKYDDELDKKIEETIERIKREGAEAREKVEQTFKEVHKKLEEEEDKIMKELERVCNESEEVLQRNLKDLRDTREYSKVLNEADSKGNEMSRLMELNLVCSMEEQRRRMEELHRMMMTNLKIVWNSEGRKLSFTRTLINGAPIPNNITFPSVLSRGMEISWDCDLSRMSEDDKRKVTYVAEVKKGTEEERRWREVYSGSKNKCSVSGLDKDSEYNVRVKCVIGEHRGGWSDVVSVRTKNLIIDSSILSQERGKETFKKKLIEWCRTSEFELLYRGTRNGFGASDFHRRCDNRGKTLVLIKNSSGHVFGGFASVSWESTSSWKYKQAPGSFLFTLTNMHGIQPTKFSLMDGNNEYGIYNSQGSGPDFGSNDIRIYSDCNTNAISYSSFPNKYNDTTGKEYSIFSSSTSTNYFQVQEIEVFRVNA